MYVNIIPPQFVMSRKQNLLSPWLLLIHIIQVNLSVHLAYTRGINNFMEQSHVSTNFVSHFCFYHLQALDDWRRKYLMQDSASSGWGAFPAKNLHFF